MFVIRLLYIPFGIVAGFFKRRIGQQTFQTIWAAIDDAPPPNPTAGQGSIARVVGSHMLRAGVMAGTAAAVDRTFALAFRNLIGAWPGKPAKPPDK